MCQDCKCDCLKARHTTTTLYFDSFENCDFTVPEQKIEKVMVNKVGPMVHVNIYEDRGDFFTTGTPATFNFNLPVQSKVEQLSVGVAIYSTGGQDVNPMNIGTSSGDVAVHVESYAVGTASQAGTVVTGVGTTFLPSMIGGKIKFANGKSAKIVQYISPTSLVVDKSRTIADQTYKICYSYGRVYLIGPPLEGSEADHSQLTMDFTYITKAC